MFQELLEKLARREDLTSDEAVVGDGARSWTARATDARDGRPS